MESKNESEKPLNDKAWEKLFEKYKIFTKLDEDGFFIISSNEINEIRNVEIMTEFASESKLPLIFSDKNLSIIPLSNSSFIISTFKTFQRLTAPPQEITPVNFPSHIQSIDYRNINSKANAVSCAFLTKMLHDFSEEAIEPTISGEIIIDELKFIINSKGGKQELTIENIRINIDGGFEGHNSMYLIIAKNSILDESDDLLISNLYFPYRQWEAEISKRIRPIFLTYSNGLFHFREFQFIEKENINSIKLVKQKVYSIWEESINNEVLQNLSEEALIVKEPEIPFPQADTFQRVINLCELLSKTTLTKDEITLKFQVKKRQTNYYTDAARYLGLVVKSKNGKEVIFKLSEKGKSLFKINIYDRQIEFIRLILSHKVFNDVLALSFKVFRNPKKSEIVAIMKKAQLYGINSDDTFERRALTVSKWIKWILDLREE